MLKEEPLSLFGSLKLLYGLTDLNREGWLRRGIPEYLCESVAGHIYRSARAAFHYTRDSRLVKMLSVHDWGEAIIGDITPHDNVDPHEKRRLETDAMKRITSPLPFGDKVMELWLEYEDGNTVRAKMAKQLDKLDAAVMALVYEDMGFNVSEFYPYTRERLSDPALLGVFDILLRREHDLRNSHNVYFRLLAEARDRR